MKFIPDTEKAESSEDEPIGMSEDEEEGGASDDEQEDDQQEARENNSPIPAVRYKWFSVD